MASRKRKCIICQKEYEWCNNCDNNVNKNETWRNLYCSKNCNNIFNILSQNAFGHIDDAKAKEMLKNVDISKIDTFREDFKKQIRKIQSVPNQPQQQPQKPQFQQQENSQIQQNKEKEIVKQDFKKQN